MTEEDVLSLERVQKAACQIILQNDYTSYQDALNTLALETLFDRRESLCLKFAKKGLKLAQFKDMFIVNSARTERYLKSSIPSMQRMLNKHERQLRNNYVTDEIYPCGSLVNL